MSSRPRSEGNCRGAHERYFACAVDLISPRVRQLPVAGVGIAAVERTCVPILGKGHEKLATVPGNRRLARAWHANPRGRTPTLNGAGHMTRILWKRLR